MTILVASKGMDPAAWMAALQAAEPARRIITLADWPNCGAAFRRAHQPRLMSPTVRRS